MENEEKYIVEIERVNATEGCHKALSILEEALSKFPGSPRLQHINGMNLFALNRYEEALSSFKKAAVMEPDEENYLVSAGKALNVLERYGEALVYFEKAVELAFDREWVRALEPGSTGGKSRLEIRNAQAMDLFYNIAEALNDSGQPKKALEHLDWKMNLNDPAHYLDYVYMGDAQFLKGEILSELGKKKASLAAYEEGLRYLDRAIEMEPGDAANYQNKGEVLKDLGRDDEAMACFRKAKEVEPDIYIEEIDGALPKA